VCAWIALHAPTHSVQCSASATLDIFGGQRKPAIPCRACRCAAAPVLEALAASGTSCAALRAALLAPTTRAQVLEALAESGTKCVAIRAAGFNNVDLDAAKRLNLPVVRVPAYSPNAIAEHTLALILALNRNIHRAYNRVRDRNFSLHGLVGFDMKGALRAPPPRPRDQKPAHAFVPAREA
jgi:D-isomer specific 2-hydroxyacid dehydrogenase, catalytic domain